MYRTILLIIVCASSFCSQVGTTWAFPESVLKDFENRLSAKICEDGGKWLTCYQLQPDQCRQLIGDIVSACTKMSLGSIQTEMSYEDGLAKAKQLDGCINEKFLSAYGSGKKSSPDCTQPPPHLRG